MEDSEELSIELSSTLYNDKCFLHDHIDGKSPVKNYASILIYLNENRNEEDGGNLILRGDDKIDYKVVPEFGRVTIIDLQNFDIYHAVEKIINNKKYTINDKSENIRLILYKLVDKKLYEKYKKIIITFDLDAFKNVKNSIESLQLKDEVDYIKIGIV